MSRKAAFIYDEAMSHHQLRGNHPIASGQASVHL